MSLTRGRTLVYERDDRLWKRCECGAEFEAQFNSRGQMTSRKLCTPCRELRLTRKAADLPNIPADARRCVDCEAICGLQYGSSVTHLDDNGRCSDCARWEAKTYARELREKEGLVMRGGVWVNPASDPTSERRSRAPGTQKSAIAATTRIETPKTSESALGAREWHTGNEGLDLALVKVGKAFGFTPEELLEHDRSPARAVARFGIWRALVGVGWSWGRIGRVFGRHHSAVLPALQSRSPAVKQAEAVARAYVRPDPLSDVASTPTPDAPCDGITDVQITAAWWAADRLAQYAGYDGVAALGAAGRTADLSRVRHAIAQELAGAGWTRTLIGGVLNRHHTTVLAGLERRHAEITHYRLVYAGLLAQGVLAPDPQVVAQVRGRAAELNRYMLRSARQPVKCQPFLPGPPGYVRPSMLARRWDVSAGDVRYWIHTGRLPAAVRGPDGRWWLPADTDLAELAT